MTDIEIANKKIAILKESLVETLNALHVRNNCKPYRCLDEVFSFAEKALLDADADWNSETHVYNKE